MASMAVEDERLRDFGDEETLKVMRALATAKIMAELGAGKSAFRDAETAGVAYRSMVGVLDAIFHLRPGGPDDSTDPTEGQDSLKERPYARTYVENIRDSVLEGLTPALPGLRTAFKKEK